MSSFELVDPREQQRLISEKIEARKQLLCLSAENAQQLVDQVLFPDCWDLFAEALTWDNSLPTADGETDS